MDDDRDIALELDHALLIIRKFSGSRACVPVFDRQK